jgi:mono/diheme cytochrome c family protein
VLFSLSTEHEIGLAVAGAAFITFSLLSSFVFPRNNPNFPGRKGLRWYLPLCFLFFIGMLAAVLVYGREKPIAEAAAAGTAPAATTTPSAPSTSTPSGNPAAGKTVFTSAGCAACHTFAPAGSTGKVGPNLDDLAQYAQKAGVPLGAYTLAAITTPPAKYIPPGFPTNAMPTTFGTTLSKQQLADLVAFLDAGAGSGG